MLVSAFVLFSPPPATFLKKIMEKNIRKNSATINRFWLIHE